MHLGENQVEEAAEEATLVEAPITPTRSELMREAVRAIAGVPASIGRVCIGGSDDGAVGYRAQLRRDLELGRLLRLAVIVVELALVAVAIRLANIETRAFESVLMLALGGFLVHHFLPAAWRINFFAALSIASAPLVFGWEAGMWLLAAGGLLIAICHLPVAFWIRIALMAAVGLALALARKQALPQLSAIPTVIWPILGSMFMFRLIIYIYDLKHGAGPFSVGRAFSYFFMLPNVCFPLFPVVDYKTLQRSIYNDDPLRLYQTGVKWMLRGLIQLTLYKAVYFLAVIEPTSAVNGTDAARYMVATFLLYLKISGLFHLIVGMLNLYGFGLAETHHFYLFSSSFTDFWRRINIYWKDFIQKLIFNPAYFSLRKRGETLAIACATLIAFAATWLLHSYQWFWIRGEFPIVWADIVFWLGLGLVVLVNVLLESRKGRQRSLTQPARTFRSDALLAVKIAGTFITICVLWTIWSTPNLEELGFVWRALLNSGPLDLAVLLGIPACLGVLGSALRHRRREVFGGGASKADKPFFVQAAAVISIASLFIVVALQPALLKPVSPALVTLAKDMRDRTQLNAADSKKFIRGYYEDLGDAARFDGELWKMYGMQPPDWKGAVPTRARNDAIESEFVPSTATIATGGRRTINSLGLRDREYPIEPGPDTFRIGLVGASHDMGWGVKDDETYENIVEDRLNRELGPLTGKKFEILNFSFQSYRPTQKLAVIEQRIFPLKPDLVLYVAATLEFDWVFKSVRNLVRNHSLDQFPFIKSAMDRADVRPEALPGEEVLASKLAPFAEQALRAVFERFRDEASSRGIRPALVLLEIPNDSRWRDKAFDRLAGLGQSAKLPVLDLQGSFSKVRNRQSLWVAAWDEHTNAQGHRLLAERLYGLLLQEGLVPGGAPSAPPKGQDAR
jgi:D-alanyl-lipoteichoic acid acyltransferase DltB (MBOAT superfamily)